MILDKITAHKRAEIAKHKRRTSESELRAKMAGQPSIVDFAAALRGQTVALIAEIKRASPSKGVFAPDLNAEAVASVYAKNGASTISVLTDARFFGGHLGDLEDAKQAVLAGDCAIPVLRKDFILDPYQVLEARSWGADAVLLIVRILSDEVLFQLYAMTVDLGMSALVEVHDAADIERIKKLRPAVVGINSRNLADFSVDLNRFGQLRQLLTAETIAVAASGIQSAADVTTVGAQGADAVLVGEALVTATDIGAKVSELSSVAVS